MQLYLKYLLYYNADSCCFYFPSYNIRTKTTKYFLGRIISCLTFIIIKVNEVAVTFPPLLSTIK